MMNGIFVLDKPVGMTSQQAVSRVKRILGAKKAGHGGTLDPDATGVLPVYLGQATRLSMYALGGDKAYLAEATFGFSTDTQDASGKVVDKGDPSHLTEKLITEALMQFVGTYEQLPPQFSALKINGKPAYELARQGIEVELKPREVVIDDIQIEQILLTPSQHSVRFFVGCGKGTYIRTLCHDLGQALGVPAHMSSLRRTKSGMFSISEAHSLTDLEEYKWSLVQPMGNGVKHLPMVTLDDDLIVKILHGQTVALTMSEGNILLPNFHEFAIVRVHDQVDRLIAICEVLVDARERINLRPQKVFLIDEVGL